MIAVVLADRIKGRLIEIEVGEVEGLGWIALGVVRRGLVHEVGMRFEAKAEDPIDAEQSVRAEIEAYFV